jgi:hypothetical protein
VLLSFLLGITRSFLTAIIQQLKVERNGGGGRTEEEMREMGEVEGGCTSDGGEIKRKGGGYMGGGEKRKGKRNT